MKEHSLLVQKNQHLKATRTGYRSKPKACKLNEIWGIDMTKFKIHKSGWAYLVIVLDWYSKKIVGYELANQSKTAEWLSALNKGLCQQFADGARGRQLKLISDNGCQPTSLQFMEACSLCEIQQIFTSYNNPKGNADTERMMRTIKEELIWLREWNNLDEIKIAFAIWVEKYNTSYLHSALGYKSPQSVEQQYNQKGAA